MTELMFMMGQYEARIPTDRLYATNHMWGQRAAECYRFGFTAYAERLLRDVYFLEWSVDIGIPLRHRQLIGEIESKKAESELFAPVAGHITQINDELVFDPSAINSDMYGAGWLFEMKTSDDQLMSPSDYITHLQAVWEVTQKAIKDGTCKFL